MLRLISLVLACIIFFVGAFGLITLKAGWNLVDLGLFFFALSFLLAGVTIPVVVRQPPA